MVRLHSHCRGAGLIPGYDRPRQHIKKQRRYFVNKGPSSQNMVFPVVMYRCESWTIKKAECWRIEAFFSFLKKLIYFNWSLITLQYCSGFCHTLTWISRGCTCAPRPEPPSHITPHPIPQGHPSAPVLSTLSLASNLDWWSVSHMIIYVFQYYSFKSSHPRLLPQSPKDCSIHLCLFCCLAYRVIVTIFLNSIYAC